MSKFRDIAEVVVKTGYWIIPVFILSVLGVLIGFAGAKSDYLSSYHGYIALGTRKPEGLLLGFQLAQWIAAAPQVLQVIFLYVLGSTEKKMNVMQAVGYFTIWFICFLFDTGTDVYFKAGGMDLIQWIVAFFETLFINTVVSEFALVICIGLIFNLTVPALKAIVDLVVDAFDMLVQIMKRLGHILSDFIESGKREIGDDEPQVKINGMRR